MKIAKKWLLKSKGVQKAESVDIADARSYLKCSDLMCTLVGMTRYPMGTVISCRDVHLQTVWLEDVSKRVLFIAMLRVICLPGSQRKPESKRHLRKLHS